MPVLSEVLEHAPFSKISDGSGESHFSGPSGWIYGLQVARLYGEGYPNVLAMMPDTHTAVYELQETHDLGCLMQVMVNILAPYSYLSPHRDGLPDHARYHLPLQTSEHVTWWDEHSGYYRMNTGQWYGPVNYCGALHSMYNDGSEQRIHLIADFEKRVTQ